MNVSVNHKDVVICGGGVAGITAAAQLETFNRVAEKNKKPQISYALLERDSKLGGRVQTLGGMDIGGTWSHMTTEEPNNFYKLPKTLYGTNGLQLDEGQPRAFCNGEEKTNGFIALQQSYEKKIQEFATLPADVSLASALGVQQNTWRYLVAEALYGASETAMSIEHIAAHNFFHENHLTAGYLVKCGMGTFIQDYAAKRINSECIQLNTTLTTVDYSNPQSIKISALDREGNIQEYHARSAIIALPLSVIKEGAQNGMFEPSLPQTKQDALNNMEMALMNKVFLPMDANSPFFKNQNIKPNTHLYTFSDTDTWFYHAMSKGKPGLVLLMGGDRAKLMEQEGQQAAIDYALAGLRAGFGDQVVQHDIIPYLQKNKIHVTEWGKTAFKGAYSAVLRGAPRQEFLQSVPGVSFCGEFCDETFGGQIAGAYWSAIKAAREVTRHLGFLPKTNYANNSTSVNLGRVA